MVDPEAWRFHKELTFTRRKTSAKIHMDLYGICYVATQLGNFSEEAIAELLFLGSQHPKWIKILQDNLRNWINNDSPLEWAKLETQDPSGKLERLHFEHIVGRILQGKSVHSGV